jgi:hypothetical protein
LLPALSLGPFFAHAVLFSSQDFVVDQPLVAELQQACLFLLQGLQPLLGPCLLTLGSRLAPLGPLADGRPHPFRLRGGEAIGLAVFLGVEPLHRLFDPLCPQMGRRAAASQVVAAEALEVLVPPTVPAHWRVDQLPAALATEERALEVVLVLTRSVATQRVAREHRLDALEDLAADQRLVQAVGILYAVQRDDPDVEIVAQNAVDGTPRQRACWPLLGDPRP